MNKQQRVQGLKHQAGHPKARPGAGPLCERNHHIFNADKPVLCVLHGHQIPVRPDGGFETCVIPRDPHVEAFNNHSRTQWVELPVRFAGQVVAKIVLDHVGPALPKPGQSSAQFRDAFSLAEMRMVSRVHHLLEVAARGLEASNTIAQLSAQGLHVDLLAHFCQHVLLCLHNAPPNANLKEEVDKAFKSFHEFEAFFSRPSAKQSSVGQILTQVKSACEHLGDDKQIDIEINVPKASVVPKKIGRAELSLFLIVVTLIENSISHLRKGADEQRIDVTARPRDNRLVIAVSDHGTGIAISKANEIKRILQAPFDYVLNKLGKRTKEGGLVLSAMLAKHEAWEFRLSRPRNPTIFELVV